MLCHDTQGRQAGSDSRRSRPHAPPPSSHAALAQVIKEEHVLLLEDVEYLHALLEDETDLQVGRGPGVPRLPTTCPHLAAPRNVSDVTYGMMCVCPCGLWHDVPCECTHVRLRQDAMCAHVTYDITPM